MELIVSGARELRMKEINGMSIREMMSYLEDFGYSVGCLSNDEIVDLCIELIDGHNLEDDVGELDFGAC